MVKVLSRSYGQFCALAYALDVVGERWTLLIIRELLNGPRRYTDLMEGLPGISTNLLADRLRNLEEWGVIGRRVLPPPAGSTVYELTPVGMALERATVELGRWGAQFLPPSLEGLALPSVGSMALAMKAFFRPEAALEMNETFELRLGEEALQVQIREGVMRTQQGAGWRPDAILEMEMGVFVGLFAGQLRPDEALGAGLVRVVEGDEGALGRYLRVCGLGRY
jgi:DNA-binding HxlR family transcriptional regulator